MNWKQKGWKVIHTMKEDIERNELQKKTRRIDEDLLEQRRKSPCVACGTAGTEFNPIDPDHIGTRGAGNDDTPDNIWSLCRSCHTKKGMGFGKFLERYPKAKQWLIDNGRTDVFERLKRR